MKVLDLFSGIGGFSLGLERAGMKTVAFCEIEDYPRRVLAKHWPDVPIYNDVRELTGERIRNEVGQIDLICGGFPCTDISVAGKGAGITGKQSGLWSEYARLIDEVGPRWVIIENVAALRSKGLVTVLQNLSEIGYDAEWHCIPASYVGAEHQRDRIWIIAYPDSQRELQPQIPRQNKRGRIGNDVEENASDSCSVRLSRGSVTGKDGTDVAGVKERLRLAFSVANTVSRHYWDHQPLLGRGVHGVSNRVDRIKALGNSVVPQIPELIGRAILAFDGQLKI